MENIHETAITNSFIQSLKTNYQGSVEALFDRLYLSSSVNEEFDHPPVSLRYMVEDYWELLFQERVN